MRRSERDGSVRAADAWEVFKFLCENMPQPQKKDGTQSKQFQLSARFQRYVCREDQIVGEMVGNDKIVKIIEPRGGKGGKRLKGIMGMYQLRVNNTLAGTRQILYRTITCWCRCCVIGDFDNCVEGSAWTLVDLQAMTREEARYKRLLQSLPETVYSKTFRLNLSSSSSKV